MTYTDIFQAWFLAVGLSGGPKSRALFLDLSAGKRAHWRRCWSSPWNRRKRSLRTRNGYAAVLG